MLTFIHTYTDYSWQGTVKQGLWREGDGLKLMHKTYYPPYLLFNSYASIPSPLYNTLNELRCPFYIDRLSGGIPIPHWYTYDKKLLNEYKNMLGDNFWGFQLHEWTSNFRAEAVRLKDYIEKWKTINPGKPVTQFWEAAIKAGNNNSTEIYTETYTPEEWSKMLFPETYSDFLIMCKELIGLRKTMTGCNLIPADSFYMAPRLEIENGAELLLQEIGRQITGTRFQIAYTRGMARAANIRWGVYYECWGHADNGVLTVPYSADSNENEWHELHLLGQTVNNTNGKPENGGSSRSLQERSWIYSYFSGATVIGEEYGVCNTFRNYIDFELSEYGKVKKAFLDFTDRFRDIGKVYTPFAIVISPEINIYDLDDNKDSYLGFTLPDSLSDKVKTAKNGIKTLLYTDKSISPFIGNEAHSIQNNSYPDIFDVIHSDMEQSFSRYKYLIDLTGDTAFAKNKENVVSVSDVKRLFPSLLPCTLTNDIFYAFNRISDGWLMLVMNNNGVLRTSDKGDTFLSEATIVSEVIWSNMIMNITALEGNIIPKQSENRCFLEAKPGSWAIFSIH